MNIYDWLDEKNGRASEMASHFGLTLGAISQWRDGVPYNRMKEVEAYTEGAVTMQEMFNQRINKKITPNRTDQ